MCRCSHPSRHGDAFSYTGNGSEGYDGIVSRDLHGEQIGWEEECHRVLDVLGKDYDSDEECRGVFSQVLDAATVRAKEQKRANAFYLIRRGEDVRRGLKSDVVWHGRVNTKRCVIFPPPNPRNAYIGAVAGYRPGGAVAPGRETQVQGRVTMMGLPWGASRFEGGTGGGRGGR